MVDRSLTLMFDFQPENRTFQVGPDSQAYEFIDTSYRDLNGDRIRDVVGGFAPLAMIPEFPRPVMISWQPSTGAYEVTGLTQSPPYLGKIASRGAWGWYALRTYRTVDTLEDRPNQVSVTAYPVETFVMLPECEGFSTIVAAFVATAPDHAEYSTFEIATWTLRLGGPAVIAEGGSAGVHPKLYPFDPKVPLAVQLLDTLSPTPICQA